MIIRLKEPDINDPWRAQFYHGYIGQLHRAVTEDKVNVFGYTGIVTLLILKILLNQSAIGIFGIKRLQNHTIKYFSSSVFSKKYFR